MTALVALLAAAPGCRRPSAAPEDASEVRVSRAPAAAIWSGYALRPAERRAVENFLKANPALRVATDDDRREPEADPVRDLYGVYHPYFLRGDVNDDAVLDFVLAFVRRDSDRDAAWFSVVVFAGNDRGGFGAGTFIERDVSLSDGDVSIDRDAIVITPDLEEDESTRRYRWDPVRRAYVFVAEDPEEDDRAPSTRT